MSTELKLFLTIWLVYALYATPAGGVTPNRYIDLVHSIVNEGRFAIDTYQDNTIDKAYYNGHYYAGALPGPAFLSVPAYVVFKGIYALVPSSVKNIAAGVQSYQTAKQPDSSFYGRVDNVEFFFSQAFLILAVLAPFSALGTVLLFKTIRLLGYDSTIALTATLLYAFGSIVFFYSTTFFEQVFSATLGIASFYTVLRINLASQNTGKPLLLILAGFLSGCGLLVEYTTIFITCCLAVWLLFTISKREFLCFALGVTFPVLMLMGYDYALFSNPFTTPYAHLIPEFDSVHGVGFFGATYPHWDRFVELVVGLRRGLFLFMPISAIALGGLVWKVWKRTPPARVAMVCLGIVAMYIIFFSSYTNWQGGAAFGPRYLIATLPFLFIGVAYAFDFLPRWLTYGVGFASVGLNWLGAQFGFAESPLQHIQDMLVQGPTLPVFGAILTHSTSHESTFYLFAVRYHAALTLAVTIGLIGIFLWAFRDILFRHVNMEKSDSGNTSVEEIQVR